MSIFDGLTFNFDKFAKMPRCYYEFGDNTKQNKGCTLTALWTALGFESKTWFEPVMGLAQRPEGRFIHPLTQEPYNLRQMVEHTDAWAMALINEPDFAKQIMGSHDGGNERQAMALVFKLLRAAKLYPLQPQGVTEDAPVKAPAGSLV